MCLAAVGGVGGSAGDGGVFGGDGEVGVGDGDVVVGGVGAGDGQVRGVGGGVAAAGGAADGDVVAINEAGGGGCRLGVCLAAVGGVGGSAGGGGVFGGDGEGVDWCAVGSELKAEGCQCGVVECQGACLHRLMGVALHVAQGLCGGIECKLVDDIGFGDGKCVGSAAGGEVSGVVGVCF